MGGGKGGKGGKGNGRGAHAGGRSGCDNTSCGGGRAAAGKGKDKGDQFADAVSYHIKESKVELSDESKSIILDLVGQLMVSRGEDVPTGEKKSRREAKALAEAGDAEALVAAAFRQDACGKAGCATADEEAVEPRADADSGHVAGEDEAASDGVAQADDDTSESGKAKRRREKEEERKQRRLMRQLISHDNEEAMAQAKEKGGHAGGKTKDKGPSSETTVRLRISDEAKMNQKPKGPIAFPRGGSDALDNLLVIARNKLGIKSKKALWAYVAPTAGQAPLPLTETASLADDCLVVISTKPQTDATVSVAAGTTQVASREGSPGHVAAGVGVDSTPSSGATALDSVRDAYSQRASQRRAEWLAIGSAELPELSRKLATQATAYATVERFRAMREQRLQLPAAGVRAEFLCAVAENQVVVVSGATGSGKTTQCPNFILEEAAAAGRGGRVFIICTQPRRIAAIGVAERVAQERGELAGETVGYMVRLDRRSSKATRLMFCTTGVLLQRLYSSPLLDGVTHVFVDEVHERNLQADFLLIVLRDMLPRRPDLKLILMSATVEKSLFTEYFSQGVGGGATRRVPVVGIPGRTYPVTTHFLREAQAAAKGRLSASVPQEEGAERRATAADTDLDAWVRQSFGFNASDKHQVIVSPEVSGRPDYALIANLVAAILKGGFGPEGMDDGAILIFLPGHAEIESTLVALRSHPGVGADRASLLPLHGSLPTAQQRRVFRNAPDGIRKVIVSTNIAETSITIDDVTHVIDTGHVRETRYDPRRAMSVMPTVYVSQAAARQRAGRAGRVRPGVCWRLFEQRFFEESLPRFTLCEMRRTALEELVLQIRFLELADDPRDFLAKAPEPPSKEAVACALKALKAIGALAKSTDLELTPLGFHLAHLPMDARVGKMLIYGALCRCLAPALTIAACLAHQSPFARCFGRQREEQLRSSREARFGESYSDHLAAVAAFAAWDMAKHSGGRGEAQRICEELGLSSSALEAIAQLRAQFLRHLVDAGFVAAVEEDGGMDVNAHCDDQRLLRCVLCAGLFPNVAQIQRYTTSHGPRSMLVSWSEERCAVHPSSMNARHLQDFAATTGWLLYHSKVQTSQVFLHDSTLIGSIPLLLFGGELRVESGRKHVSVDGVIFDVRAKEVAVLFKLLRRELDRILLVKIGDPAADLKQTAAPLLLAITRLLELEEAGARGLVKPGPPS